MRRPCDLWHLSRIALFIAGTRIPDPDRNNSFKSGGAFDGGTRDGTAFVWIVVRIECIDELNVLIFGIF